jgi:DNA-binding SARP family transcriptional activator
LAVWTTDGRPVPVPEAKVRALLAILLLQDGRPVSRDRLVDDLWGANPPGNPTGAVQTKVSQLRKALGAAETGGRDLVAHRSTGYVLKADALDAAEFRELAARARAAEDPHERVTLWSEALALWRGPALADFVDEPYAQAAIQRLEEERLVVLEARAEARLELGEHREVVVELTDLVERHPLREALRALQLRALYRSGRQTEALDAYRELRTRLADELGLEPGPELAAVHQSILEQTAPVRPRSNLPTPLTELVGRAEAVAEVRRLVQEARLVTLTGPGGVGKTRLAVATARQVVVRDGAWLVELAGLDRHASPVEETVAAALGVREDRGTVADALRGKEILLVLDNCERSPSWRNGSSPPRRGCGFWPPARNRSGWRARCSGWCRRWT